MNKSIIIVAGLVVVLVIGVFGYQYYFHGAAPDIENSAGGAATQEPQEVEAENLEGPSVNVEAGIMADPENGGGTLTICLDECGNGVCQAGAPTCEDYNCVCPETPKECPQDCK